MRQAFSTAIEALAVNDVDAIVSAYGLTENDPDSALARTNQTPYEALFQGAQTSEMSGEKMSHIWPLIIETTRLWKQATSPEAKAKL
ncbi:uncharacterized protein A1O9_11315 [Exophiala aquamarina CBS 119918]|uniref:Uncharacterized protein n=1 Tax=Exophiala aquamarina CBS 119918 TaxID=1182545 RepID=A0A072NZL7_9EURO|nr:uncharacterized protein A1O9_11315 [Exophiala aquamarina CBS 119918]KEF52473.1 hypothetical protein A1O9_11315 [Exophiala aquamarina CBS 119918]